MTDATVTALHPFGETSPARAGEVEGRRTKDRTAAERQRRRREREAARKRATAAMASAVTAPPVTPVTAPVTAAASPVTGTAGDLAAYAAAIALASAAAWFSIRGMVVLFPGSPLSVIGMACAMEAGKLVTAGWLARRWRATAWLWRAVLVAGLAVINATGVYAQLVAAHIGDRGAAQSAVETEGATLAARIDVQAHVVADLDARVSQIDHAVEEAARRGKTNAALSAIEGQRKARAGLVDERKREAGALTALHAERAGIVAKGRQIATETAPIRYVAELVGAGGDDERAVRWLIALMVLCCDPLAIALTAAAASRP
jgi:hypothetical protein